jgi:CheY-like chemotaxis protein
MDETMTTQSSGYEIQHGLPHPTASILSYVTACHSCGEPVEALDANWCNCVNRKPSIACGSCGNCLCLFTEESLSYWLHAPDWLTARRTVEQARRRSVARVGSVSGKTDVLIVDDDEEIRLVAAYMVEQMGYRVVTAANAVEAFARIEESTPRLVLSDALMPKVDGRELCRLIKLAEPEVKVIIMTSLYTKAHHKYEAFRTFRADDYLSKPIDFQLLKASLERLAPQVEA